MKTKPAKRDGTQAVRRAIAILRAFSPRETAMGVAEISHKTGLHVATAHRLLKCLVQEGLINQDRDTGKYRLGMGLIPLADLARQSNVLPLVAERHARDLAQQWGEAVNVDVFDHGLEMISILAVASSHLLRVSADYVVPQPPNCTSTGKVLLAFSPSEVLESVLAKGLVARTGKTITDPEALRQELALIRERGYATNLEELEQGVHAIGAPIRDGSGNVVAALSCGGPAVRVTLDKLPAIAQSVIEAAGRISEELAWSAGLEPARLGEHGA